MKNFYLALLFGFALAPLHAAEISVSEMIDQDKAQNRCVQKSVAFCKKKCLKKLQNCAVLCQKNSKNQCRQAGE